MEVKQHSIDPGPIYKIDLDMSKPSCTLHNLPKYSFPKGKVADHLTLLQNISKTIPGAGKYNPIRKTKILGNYLYKTPIGAFTDEAISRAYDTPGPYNLIDTERYKMPRTPFVKIIKENESAEKA